MTASQTDSARQRTIAVSGSSGLVGSALLPSLEADGWTVRRLVRRTPEDPQREIHWDPAKGSVDAAGLAELDAIVHLAGESLAEGRWNESKKQRIYSSRVDGTRFLCDTLANLDQRPHVLISASAIGYYGNRGDTVMDESTSPGDDFLAHVCRDWESATEPAASAGIRVVNPRIGVVLSPKGGALAKMLTPFKLGAGGVVGSGDQYVSWIALGDLVRVIVYALHHEMLSGPVNAATPHPVTNRELTKTLGKVLHRPTVVPLPAFAAKLAFGEMAEALLLSSTRVEPAKLQEAGFSFEHPELDAALRHLLREESRQIPGQ